MADEIIARSTQKMDPDKINPKLAALAMARELMSGDNPTTAVIDQEFNLGRSLMGAINTKFFDGGLDGVMEVFTEFERHSPSISGIGRQQVVECVVNASRPVYQGFNPMADEDKGPGVLSKIAAFIRGSPAPQK